RGCAGRRKERGRAGPGGGPTRPSIRRGRWVPGGKREEAEEVGELWEEVSPRQSHAQRERTFSESSKTAWFVCSSSFSTFSIAFAASQLKCSSSCSLRSVNSWCSSWQ